MNLLSFLWGGVKNHQGNLSFLYKISFLSKMIMILIKYTKSATNWVDDILYNCKNYWTSKLCMCLNCFDVKSANTQGKTLSWLFLAKTVNIFITMADLLCSVECNLLIPHYCSVKYFTLIKSYFHIIAKRRL